jgi:hypothetical protein
MVECSIIPYLGMGYQPPPMSNFFRKIRKQLANDKNTMKYWRYAFGEIVLVVVGILIAIQLNEWRNDHYNKKQKQNVLKALRAEFQSNLSQLDTILFYNDQVLNGYPVVMGLINSNIDPLDKKVISKLVNNLGYTWSFNPINGALRSGISSGEIHLITNKRLIELLFSWEDVVKDSEEEATKIRAHQGDAIALLQKYIRIGDLWQTDNHELKYSSHPADYSGLFKDVLFEDYAAISFHYASEYATELAVIKTNNLEILELIERELVK